MIRQPLVTLKARLENTEEPAYRALLDRCNAAEGIDLPFFFDEAAPISDAVTAFYIWAGPVLIGFGHLPDEATPEAVFMVDPEHRRKGFGGALLTAIKAELTKRGRRDALVVADQASESGKAFLSGSSLSYQSSEFRLELDRTAIDRSRPRLAGFSMRAAEWADLETIIEILVAAFGESPADARDLVERGLNERSRRFYVGMLDDAAVGVLRAGEIDGLGDITALGVRPEFQGQGVGRQMLLETIDLLTVAGLDSIALEVATENANALGLYESCGFRVASEYGFYSLKADE